MHPSRVTDGMDQIRTHWLANLTHDLRGPLFAARGYARLLLEERDGPLTVAQKRWLEKIDSILTCAASLADDLQTVPGGDTLQVEPLNLAQLVRDAAARAGDGRHLSTDGVAAQMNALGDPGKLSAALRDFFSAAADFAGPTGKVEVQTGEDEENFELRVNAMASNSAPAASPVELGTALKIWRLHGGTTHVHQDPENGFEVCCRLPRIRLSECT